MEAVRGALGAGWRRVRAVAGPIAETSLAAAIAWYIAHVLLGHPRPFFAPIAAAVALSTSHVQRARRSVQMVGGVLLGIGVAELLGPLIGNTTVSIGVVVAVTLVIAVAVGGGFFAEGMMFVNQAAASAILVIALHRAGTGSERAVDALVGGAVALVIGVGLFPADPLALLWRAEDAVLRAVLAVLSREPLPDQSESGMDWALAASHEVHRRLSALTAARSTARASVRVAPRRMPLRGQVDAEERRVSSMYLLAGGVLSLVREIADESEASADGHAPREAEVRTLAEAVRPLLAAERPWSAPAVIESRRAAERLLAPAPVGGEQVSVGAQRVARDLLKVLPDSGG